MPRSICFRPELSLKHSTPSEAIYRSMDIGLAVVCGHCLVTLSLTINETLKWLLSLPILMQESFWW